MSTIGKKIVITGGKRIVVVGANFETAAIDLDIYTLSSIEITKLPFKTVYQVGEVFSKNGMIVTATYIGVTSGKSVKKTVTNYEVTPVNTFTSVGVKTMTVTFKDNNIIKSTTLTVNVNSVVKTYTITTNISNGSVTGATSITEGNSASLNITPNTGYSLPQIADITVTGAVISEYNETSGKLVITNPTANVSISATCTLTPPAVGEEVWYTNIFQGTGHQVQVEGGSGWSPYPAALANAIGKPVNLVNFVSSNSSSVLEIGKAVLKSDVATDVQTITWDQSNKTGNIVTVELPNPITLGDNEVFVVYPNNKPGTNAFQFKNSGGEGFYCDVPVTKRGQTTWQSLDGYSLMFNFGFKTSDSETEEPPVTETYSITTNISNGSVTGATSITEGNSASLNITPNTGYSLPQIADITVTGAVISEYNETSGKLVITNPTTNVTVSATCPLTPPEVEYEDTWYTNITQRSGHQVMDNKSDGWAVFPAALANAIDKPVNLVSFVSSNSSSVLEIGKAVLTSNIATDVQTITWDQSNKTGNIVTVRIPNPITLGTNETFVVYPNTKPGTNAFQFTSSGSEGFYSHVPVSKEAGKTAWNPLNGYGLMFNFGFRNVE